MVLPSVSVAFMEPMLPPAGVARLEDLAYDLTVKSSSLASQLAPDVRESLGDLVRSMNCYYSNLIEGHDTHPRDIERALREEYASDVEKRNLQLEARAHIEVQELIDSGQTPSNVVSTEFICWLHNEFCKRLPKDLLWVKNPDTGEQVEVIPGEYRTQGVQVGAHLPPPAGDLPNFMKRFIEAYKQTALTKLHRIISVGAAHHRFLWIHPFADANGRVARLFCHAHLMHLGIGSSLWSVARGFSRNVEIYRRKLMYADSPRWNDYDGRGNLSLKALEEFIEFFLECCLDQIDFMERLLEPNELLRRIELFSRDQISAGQLHSGSFELLRHALLFGAFERGKAAELTGYKSRQARTVLSELIELGVLESNSPKGKVRLAFPVLVLERWLPRLYPAL